MKTKNIFLIFIILIPLNIIAQNDTITFKVVYSYTKNGSVITECDCGTPGNGKDLRELWVSVPIPKEALTYDKISVELIGELIGEPGEGVLGEFPYVKQHLQSNNTVPIRILDPNSGDNQLREGGYAGDFGRLGWRGLCAVPKSGLLKVTYIKQNDYVWLRVKGYHIIRHEKIWDAVSQSYIQQPITDYGTVITNYKDQKLTILFKQ